MKTIFYLFLIIIVYSCSQTRNAKIKNNETKIMFTEIFEDPFFNSYKTKKKIFLTDGGNIDLASNLYKIKTIYNISKNYNLIQNSEKIVRIEEFIQSHDFMRTQILCDEKSKQYYLLYSTSFKRNENGKMELIDKVSPFIDTIWKE